MALRTVRKTGKRRRSLYDAPRPLKQTASWSGKIWKRRSKLLRFSLNLSLKMRKERPQQMRKNQARNARVDREAKDIQTWKYRQSRSCLDTFLYWHVRICRSKSLKKTNTTPKDVDLTGMAVTGGDAIICLIWLIDMYTYASSVWSLY